MWEGCEEEGRGVESGFSYRRRKTYKVTAV